MSKYSIIILRWSNTAKLNKLAITPIIIMESLRQSPLQFWMSMDITIRMVLHALEHINQAQRTTVLLSTLSLLA